MADGFGGGVDWSPEQRTELLNWLTLCSCHEGHIEPGSPLDRALDYWLARYRDEAAVRQVHESALLPWSQTPVAQRHHMEIAFLELWRQPDRAVKTLYRLSLTLGDDIRERLSRLMAWDRRGAPSSTQVMLPWKVANRPAYVRWMLARLGFGSDEADAAQLLKPPAVLGLAWGVCGGLALASLIWLASLLMASGEPVLVPEVPEAVRQVVIWETYRTGLNTYDLVLGTAKGLQLYRSVPARSRIRVRWQWTVHVNIQVLGESERWHAGTLPQPIRPCDPAWPMRSLVVIEAERGASEAGQLAMRLLDRGSADVVLMGRDWQQQLSQVIQDGVRTERDQLVMILPPESVQPPVRFAGAIGVIRTDDLPALVEALEFEGVEPLETIWPGATIIQGAPLLHGLPRQDEESGVTFVEVCGGTFTMGSDDVRKNEDGKDVFRDEKPKHPVTLSIFEISQTEITRAQYGQAANDDGTLPAGNVTWHQAKAFCEQRGWALPTEAEWEYAARGGTTSKWSFGDDEERLDDYAWSRRLDINPVGKKLPNPLGLFDIHGNAVEWVEDCYDAETYAKRTGEGFTFVVNPQIDKPCHYRVLRGGWSDFDPEGLRSAFRFRDESEVRYEVVGFRCVRRLRRQP